MAAIRKAERKDCLHVAQMIKELAEFEKMAEEALLTAADLERDGFEITPSLFRILIAEEKGNPVGFALFYHKYSTWRGKCMVLEDLYVKPAHRNSGIGASLFDAVVATGVAEDCRRMDFEVLDWNPAQHLYKRKRAVDVTETEAWHIYRITGENMREMAKK